MIFKLWNRFAHWWDKHVHCPRPLQPAWEVFKLSIYYFREDNVHRMGAALAYYTIFSLPAILVIVIGLVGFFFGEAAVQGQIYSYLEQHMFSANKDVARQIEDAVRNIGTHSQNWWATVLGLGFLMFVATNIFYAMQETLNQIFQVEAIPRKVAILKAIINRILSFVVVMCIGGIVVLSIVLNAVVLKITDWVNTDGKEWIASLPKEMDFLSPYLDYFSGYFLVSLNLGVSIAIIAIFFVLLYKVLPAVQVGWSYALWGAFWVSLFFFIGQMLLGYYLSHTATISAYGAAGSLIVLLIWVYYSAQLFFWGAEFIRAMYHFRRQNMRPKAFAHRLRSFKS